MSTTPRTNAAWAKHKNGRGAQHLRSESCRLERELKTVTDDLAFRRELGALQQQEYDKVTAERDALKHALNNLRNLVTPASETKDQLIYRIKNIIAL